MATGPLIQRYLALYPAFLHSAFRNRQSALSLTCGLETHRDHVRKRANARVENWKRVGPELEAIKRRELRAMTEEEAFAQAEILSSSAADDIWVEPKRASSGLIEQQRWFLKFAKILKLKM